MTKKKNFMSEPVFSVSQAVAVINQTLDAVYPTLTIVGELSQFKISKQRWIYADIKDDTSKLRLFGTIYQLPMPLQDGMMVEVVAEPRIHPQFGFSLNIRSIKPVGEGSLKKAADLLQAKLEAEGLFALERKRYVEVGPERIGLITSEQSAAYADFTKILNARWQGVEVQLYDVAVQGESAPENILEALSYFNQSQETPDVLVLIRGGGSADDLSAFSTEQVTRAVGASRIPTVVAVGHENDISLSELAADLRASTPSNAAELLFPDKIAYKEQLKLKLNKIDATIMNVLDYRSSELSQSYEILNNSAAQYIENKLYSLKQSNAILESVHPKATLKRGFAIVQSGEKLVKSKKQLKEGDNILITFKDGSTKAEVKEVQ